MRFVRNKSRASSPVEELVVRLVLSLEETNLSKLSSFILIGAESL